jgi:hypothetical protein
LDTGFWLIKNKQRFVLIRNIFLGFFGVLFWGFFFSAFGAYFVLGMKQDAITIGRITQNTFPGHKYFVEVGPRDLAIGGVKIFEPLSGRYDFSVEIKNPNPRHWVEIVYTISSGDRVIESNKAIILPGVNKHILVLGKELDWRPGEVVFKLTAVNWHRVDAHKYGNWDDFRRSHLDGITISEANIVQAGENALSEKISLNSISFKIKNNTSFNYLDANFAILLSSGNRLVNVNRYIFDNFYSGVERSADIIFSGSLSGVDKIEIIPDINILDDSVFSDFKGSGFVK